MKLNSPFIITPRLMAGLKIGGAFISIGTGQRNSEGRTEYGCFIDLPDGSSHEIDDLKSGCQGGELQEGFVSLLSFLGACAESRSHAERVGKNPMDGENSDLFPEAVGKWAQENDDEIAMMGCEIEETPNLIEKE